MAALDFFLSKARDEVAASVVVVNKAVQRPAKIGTHLRPDPAFDFCKAGSLVPTLIQENEAVVTDRKAGLQDLKKSVEILDHRDGSSHDLGHDLLQKCGMETDTRSAFRRWFGV